MAAHSRILAWRIPWTEELGGLQATDRVTKSWTQLKRFSTAPQNINTGFLRIFAHTLLYILEKEGMATHSSILAQRIPMDRKAWQATVHGVAKSQT